MAPQVVENGEQTPLVSTDKGTIAGLTENEILIEDRIYDVTDFMSKHPGGRILKYQVRSITLDHVINLSGHVLVVHPCCLTTD